jgi:cytochrome b6-f complex iron-sulfur subunit
MKRKSFIQKALNVWAAIASLPVLYAIVRYVVPSSNADAAPVSVSVGKRSEFSPGIVKLVREGKYPFFVRETGSGLIESFSARCSHLGCIVQYIEDDDRFRCNCHGSLFDENGTNLTGPAIRPLQPYRVEIRGDEVVVTVI